MDERLENRRHKRVAVPIDVRLSAIDPEPDSQTGRAAFRSACARCFNLSRGGLFVRTGEPLPPGRRVLLDFDLPTGISVQAIGRVAWSIQTLEPSGGSARSSGGNGSCGMGLEFLGGVPDQLHALEQFLSGA